MLVDNDDGVRTKYHTVGVTDSEGFVTGQTLRIDQRLFIRQCLLGHVGRLDSKRDAGIAQQFGATWRGGSEGYRHCETRLPSLCRREMSPLFMQVSRIGTSLPQQT